MANIPKSMVGKRGDMLRHFRRRFSERFGFDLRTDEIEKLLVDARTQETYMASQSNDRTLRKLKVRDVEFCVIYSKKYKMFNTCFPVDWVRDDEFFVKCLE